MRSGRLVLDGATASEAAELDQIRDHERTEVKSLDLVGDNDPDQDPTFIIISAQWLVQAYCGRCLTWSDCVLNLLSPAKKITAWRWIFAELG